MASTVANQYIPSSVSPPGDTLTEVLEERGITQQELAERIGRTPKTVNEIIKGKAPITPETSLQLERALGIAAEFWDARERAYRSYVARVAEHQKLEGHVPWLKEVPCRHMVKLGWIEKCESKIDQVREVLNFFGVVSPDQWRELCIARQASYRMSTVFSSDEAAVAAWLRQGERKARAIPCLPYDRDTFREALLSIRQLTPRDPEVFEPTMVDLCSRAGVTVVFVPEIPKAPISGATRWLAPDRALIQLSLRYKSDDHFWFTFFHEAGHILLHNKKDVFIDAAKKAASASDLEKEADEFAANYLIPKRDYQRLVGLKPFSKQVLLDFADELGIAPGIVVGRLQHDRLMPFTHLNGLKKRLEWAI